MDFVIEITFNHSYFLWFDWKKIFHQTKGLYSRLHL